MDDHLLGYITKLRKNRKKQKIKKIKDKSLIHPQILQRTIEFLVSSQVLMRQVLDLPCKGGEDSCVSHIATSL